MHSEIAQRLKLKYSPVAILFTDEKPSGAAEFTEGRWGCVAALLTAAAKGRRAVFSHTTFGCPGGGIGLGMLDHYPAGLENFLSTGQGPLPPGFETRDGEAFKKTPELARQWMNSIPGLKPDKPFVAFVPLDDVEADKAEPKAVVFYVNPDQLTALIVLANYGRTGHDSVMAPFAAGCQSTCLFPCSEADKERPRAVIGLTDISVRHLLDADILSFSVPFGMFKEMEGNVPGSFLDKQEWKQLAERIPGR